MKQITVDRIFTNANVYTVDDRMPWASTIAVKDGKFVYVGNAEGAEKLEGPVTDLQGKFVMPGIIDSHVHVDSACEMMNHKIGKFLFGNSKAELIEEIKKAMAAEPEAKEYLFYINAADLRGERLLRDELDEICPDKALLIAEAEQHSRWLNSVQMKVSGIDDYRPDIAEGLSYCERDEDGRINGRIYESCMKGTNVPVCSKEQYRKGINKILEYWNKWGVIAAFDAGMPLSPECGENYYEVIREKEEKGELKQYLEFCEQIMDPLLIKGAVERCLAKEKKYATGNTHTRTMKVMMDGTVNGRTAALFENYNDTPSRGGILMGVPLLEEFLIDLNANGIDLHVHTVGERAITTVLDAVEAVKKKLGEAFRIQVTCAHIEVLSAEHLGRFARLGVIANYTPHWFGGNCLVNFEEASKALGASRAAHMYRANTVWNTGAVVCFSSDDVIIDNMKTWNPYMGMEVGMTRQDNDLTATIEDDFSGMEVYPSNEEKLSLAQMIKGFTLNGAKQMRLDHKIGSISEGKDASFLVFKENLFDVDKYMIHKQLPEQVYIRGELLK